MALRRASARAAALDIVVGDEHENLVVVEDGRKRTWNARRVATVIATVRNTRLLDSCHRTRLASATHPPSIMSRQDKAITERHTRTLRELVKRPENKVCSDCKHNGPLSLLV